MKETLLSYAEKEQRPFSSLPLNTVDSTILSWLSYIEWREEDEAVRSDKGIEFCKTTFTGSLQDMFSRMYGPHRSQRLFHILCENPRYRDIEIFGFTRLDDEVRQMQFACLSFRLPTKDIYIAFRGTDSSLYGWKEDFNLACESPIPSQEEALSTLERIAKKEEGRIYLGGHSKGGNLATYAAAKCNSEIQSRIEKVFSHDGPGFPEDFYTSEGYKAIRSKVIKTVPQSSIIGMLMNGSENVEIVRSDSISFLQHYPFNWRVSGTAFVKEEKLNADALFFNRVSSAILSRLDIEERALLVDTIYEMLRESGFKNAMDVVRLLPLALSRVLRKIKESEPDVKTRLETIAREIREAIKDSIFSS